MIVDTRNPEVSEVLARYFRCRDRLLELGEEYDNPFGRTHGQIDGERDYLNEEMVTIADDLVTFLCPNGPADRELHLSLNPEPERATR